MVEMKNIKGQPTLVLDANDLNIVMSCPHCNAKNDRIIHGKKKYKCLDCFKSFKTPKVVGKNSSNIQNIKTFNNTEIKEPTPPTPLVDIVPDPELVEFLDKLPNEGTPPLVMMHVDENGENHLITNSEEIENFINTEKNEIVLQRQEENKPILSNNSEIFIKSDLSSMIELSDKLKTVESLEMTEIPKVDKKRKIIRRINHERQM